MANTIYGRRTLQGVVVSSKMNKTIVVEVKSYKTHAKYGKRVQQSKKFKAHDEREEAREGDTVIICETRPLAKTVHFRLVKIMKRGE